MYGHHTVSPVAARGAESAAGPSVVARQQVPSAETSPHSCSVDQKDSDLRGSAAKATVWRSGAWIPSKQQQHKAQDCLAWSHQSGQVPGPRRPPLTHKMPGPDDPSDTALGIKEALWCFSLITYKLNKPQPALTILVAAVVAYNPKERIVTHYN